jgi:hypothetical protein
MLKSHWILAKVQALAQAYMGKGSCSFKQAEPSEEIKEIRDASCCIVRFIPRRLHFMLGSMAHVMDNISMNYAVELACL